MLCSWKIPSPTQRQMLRVGSLPYLTTASQPRSFIPGAKGTVGTLCNCPCLIVLWPMNRLWNFGPRQADPLFDLPDETLQLLGRLGAGVGYVDDAGAELLPLNDVRQR
eukprot:TRINITY_DN122574_c0_g1_i1.p2 TRINITY_DN122574_c0_g1~~TRINITY_DN122574_c0_g1_i1.p2  ORF type:complete len:108 (+),score=12.34 TRINITY_DN122574_c0_g1_i1:414-737(+)